ncbi:hypothetical protein QVE09_16200 [Paenibacillus sp. ClWae2A]|uniref:hypothetical protein n=1 Tax=Paenibacillus sp. ClWae2A TaxID=3057177 RepID=UPI0028F5429F|nr:hypothetical protein [Paenibacillus sp. ClWae2A]MDT9720462.1 hypothetical protein [Paenibacillus sp. ClWae2A]
MSDRRYKLLNGFTLVVSEECLGVQLDTGMTITTDGDEIIDDVLVLLDQTKSERDQAIRDLRDYKSKRGENIGEMLDARAEADRLRLELEREKEHCTKAIRLLVQVTDILSMGRTPDRTGAALKVIYQWLHDNKPESQEGGGNKCLQ